MIDNTKNENIYTLRNSHHLNNVGNTRILTECQYHDIQNRFESSGDSHDTLAKMYLKSFFSSFCLRIVYKNVIMDPKSHRQAQVEIAAPTTVRILQQFRSRYTRYLCVYHIILLLYHTNVHSGRGR